MANTFQANVDCLRKLLADKQAHNTTFGCADPRIEDVLAYIDSDRFMEGANRVLRAALATADHDGFRLILAGPVVSALMELRAAGRVSKPVTDTIKGRMTGWRRAA